MDKTELLGAELDQLALLESCDWESLRCTVIEAEKHETTGDVLDRLDEMKDIIDKIKKNVKARQKIEKKIKSLEGF